MPSSNGLRTWGLLLLGLLCAFPCLGQVRLGEAPRFEYRFRTDFEYRYRGADLSVEDGLYKNGIDFCRDFLDRPPLASLYLAYGGAEGLGVELGLSLQRQWSLEPQFTSTNLFPLGIAKNPLAVENGFVSLGILSYSSPTMEIKLGRQKVDFSDGLAGGLLPTPRLPYLDALKVHGDIGRLGVDWLLSSLRALPALRVLSEGSYVYPDVQPNGVASYTDGDQYYYGFEDGSAWAGDGSKLGNPTTILEALHRYTWSFEGLTIGGSAHVMYARRNNRYSLIDLFPVISWHQALLYQINMSMLLDARWEPLPGLWFAGQAGLDDFNANLVGINDNDASTIGACVLGGGYKGSGPHGSLELYAEAGYTHFLWGNYDGSQNPPRDKNPFLRFIYRYTVDGGSVLLPLTSPYGPGALWFRTMGEWRPRGGAFSLGWDLLALSKNSLANLVTTPYYTELEATAAGERILFLSLQAPLVWRRGIFDCRLTPELVVKDGSLGFQVSVGAGLVMGR